MYFLVCLCLLTPLLCRFSIFKLRVQMAGRWCVMPKNLQYVSVRTGVRADISRRRPSTTTAAAEKAENEQKARAEGAGGAHEIHRTCLFACTRRVPLFSIKSRAASASVTTFKWVYIRARCKARPHHIRRKLLRASAPYWWYFRDTHFCLLSSMSEHCERASKVVKMFSENKK